MPGTMLQQTKRWRDEVLKAGLPRRLFRVRTPQGHTGQFRGGYEPTVIKLRGDRQASEFLRENPEVVQNLRDIGLTVREVEFSGETDYYIYNPIREKHGLSIW